MTAQHSPGASSEIVTVRYWASARSVMGTDSDVFEGAVGLTVSHLVGLVLDRHPGEDARRVLAVCSVLAGGDPVSPQSREKWVLRPGEVVEFLPPFAGG